ncbi:MAG: thiamine pyrophosphate-dependent enzyme [Anaerotruncus sp.]|nr:thiamine pyrophosphate-dependent enzyme [Anaerotruncus sp.]
MAYQYAREAFPNAQLPQARAWPSRCRKSCSRSSPAMVEKLYVVEELRPLHRGPGARRWGSPVAGKDDPAPAAASSLRPSSRAGVTGPDAGGRGHATSDPSLPPRPPMHVSRLPAPRPVLRRSSGSTCFVCGDIGCYTLGLLPPLAAMDTCLCMGAGIGHAHRHRARRSARGKDKSVAVIGDSTFFHSGITGLIDMAYNKSQRHGHHPRQPDHRHDRPPRQPRRRLRHARRVQPP